LGTDADRNVEIIEKLRVALSTKVETSYSLIDTWLKELYNDG
jgi:hypothetical protein